MISGKATFNMAALLYSRLSLTGLSLPYTFVRRVPKISWIRKLSSDSSGNENKAEVPVSSLLEKLKSSSADVLSTKPLPEETKVTRRIAANKSESSGYTRLRPKRVDKSLEDLDKSLPEGTNMTRRKGLSSHNLKTRSQPERANTEKLKYNKVLRDLQMQEDMSSGGKSLKISESGNLLGVLKEAKQEYEQDEAKSMLGKSIEETRSRRKKPFQRITTNISESSGYMRQRPNRVDIEGLGKSLPEETNMTRRKGLSSHTLKSHSEPKIADTEELRYNKILRDLQMQEDMSSGGKSLKISESGNLLGVLKEAEQEYEQDKAKSLLEKSIEETRSRRKKPFQRIAANISESSGYTRQRPKRVDKSLEDLDKSRLNAAERSKRDVDPSLNQKIRDLLSDVDIQPKQLGTAKTIVAAVENWGTTANRQRITLMEEHDYQTKEMSSMKRPSGLMLLEGESTGLFDDIISKAKTADAKINNVTQSSFLYHLEEMDNVDKIGYLGVRRNAFADQISISNRLWQYPIDNEVCKIEEENTSFEEHVFLEYLLDDFPSKGPVRRFMELVINGLQKNPYLSVEQKKQRVRWFHDYFSNFSEEELSF